MPKVATTRKAHPTSRTILANHATLDSTVRRWFDANVLSIARGDATTVTFHTMHASEAKLTELSTAITANHLRDTFLGRGGSLEEEGDTSSSSTASQRNVQHLTEFDFEGISTVPGSVAIMDVFHGLSQCKNLTSVSLTDGSLGEEHLGHINLLLRRCKSLRRMSLKNNAIEISQIVFAGLQSRSRREESLGDMYGCELQFLDVSGNTNGTDMLKYFSVFCPAVAFLTELRMEHCAAGPDAAFYLKFILRQSSLHTLGLAGNNLGGGISQWNIPHHLARASPTLQTLDLEANNLTFADTSALSQSLQHNKNITILKIAGGFNDVAPKDWAALTKCCFNNSRRRERGYIVPSSPGKAKESLRPPKRVEKKPEKPKMCQEVSEVPAQEVTVPRVPSMRAWRGGVTKQQFVRAVHQQAAPRSGAAVRVRGCTERPYDTLNGKVGVTRGPLLGLDAGRIEVVFGDPIGAVLLRVERLSYMFEKAVSPMTVLIEETETDG